MTVQEALAALEAAARDVDQASNEACHTGKMSVTWTMLWYLRQAIAALDEARKEEAERCDLCDGKGSFLAFDICNRDGVRATCGRCRGTGKAKPPPRCPTCVGTGGVYDSADTEPLAGEREKEE